MRTARTWRSARIATATGAGIPPGLVDEHPRDQADGRAGGDAEGERGAELGWRNAVLGNVACRGQREDRHHSDAGADARADELAVDEGIVDEDGFVWRGRRRLGPDRRGRGGEDEQARGGKPGET